MGRRPKETTTESHSGDLSWDEAIKAVLSKAGGALHYGEITDRIIASNLRNSIGATPKDTVATTLSLSIRDKGSPYLKVERGVYALKSSVESAAVVGKPRLKSETVDQPDEAGAVQAFGMFWERPSVYWAPSKPKLLG